jgi:hypothetical protein
MHWAYWCQPNYPPPGAPRADNWNQTPRWTAFGDGHLFIPQAQTHIAIVTYIAAHSIHEMLLVALGKEAQRPMGSMAFPIPYQGHLKKACDSDMTRCQTSPVTDLTTYQTSTNDDIPKAPYEGWKLLVTYGEAWGRFDRYNTDLSILKKQNTFGSGSVELGYLRSVWPVFAPNYVGVGVFMVPGIQTSFFASGGYWGQPLYHSS